MRFVLIFKLCQGAYLVNDTTEQHRLAFAESAIDPQHISLFVVTLFVKIRMFKDPLVEVSQQAGRLFILGNWYFCDLIQSFSQPENIIIIYIFNS